MATWYYAEGQNQIGPFSDEEFGALAAEGKIRVSTLVWNESMPDWRPYGEVASGAAGSTGAAQVVCSMCNRIVPPEDAIDYQGNYVCAECKPDFVQRIKEGMPLPGMVYAGFWIRFVAVMVDGVIQTVFLCGIAAGSAAVIFPLTQGGDLAVEGQIIWQVFYTLGSYAVQCAYQTFFLGRYGATPGKMLLRLKVVRPDGSPITYWRAFGRYWATLLSYFTCMIGYIMAAFDDEKRALHDHICSTRVIAT